jgi:hypothetical protein
MATAPVELGRLAIMQREPLRYIERRVEDLDLVDDYHYGVTLTQQVVIPHHGDRGAAEERELLVPLGQFSKDRMPNLRVEGPDGTQLPLLSRSDRGAVGATLLANEWAATFFKGVSRGQQTNAKRAYKTIFALIARAVVGSTRDAQIALDVLERTLRAWSKPGRWSSDIQLAALALLSSKQFWTEADALAESRLLVARMRGTPGRSYTLTIRYAERFAYRGYAWGSVGGVVRKGLGFLGLIATPIARSVANLGEAASLWIVQSVPEGVEALRYYWRRERHNSVTPDPVSVEVTRAAASAHPAPGVSPPADSLLLEVQISPSTALAATMGLAALLLLVSTYVYQAIPTIADAYHAHPHSLLVSLDNAPVADRGFNEGDRALLVGLGSLFAAVPAAIAGALAYRGQSFVRRISLGPRLLLAGLSVLAAFFAVVVSLKNLGSLAEATAYAVSIYSLWVLGIFAFIQFGPRWRKSERSRRKSATSRATPLQCRRNQVWAALGWLIGWTFVVVVFARCQVALQREHFFTDEFPLNVWHAWWNLFS